MTIQLYRELKTCPYCGSIVHLQYGLINEEDSYLCLACGFHCLAYILVDTNFGQL